MKVFVTVIHVITFVTIIGCSTWKKETLAYMGGAFVGGSVVGATQAPSGDNKAMHGLLWGSVLSAAVGSTLVYLSNDDERVRQRDVEIESLKIQLSESKTKVNEGNSQFLEQELPNELQGLMEPGSWELYEIDDWKQSKKGEFVHQDKVLEIKPAKMKITK